MKICPHCHEEISEKAIKCIKCGKYIDPTKNISIQKPGTNICPYCHAEISEKAIKCIKCGKYTDPTKNISIQKPGTNICPYCYAEISEKAIKCIKCGKYIDPTKIDEITPNPPDSKIIELDLDQQHKDKLDSIWYFPEKYPLAFLYNFFFFQISLNWIINAIIEYDDRTKESGVFGKTTSGFWGASGAIYGGILTFVFWGGVIGILLMFPFIILTKGQILQYGLLDILFFVPGLYAANHIGNVRLEVMRAMNKAKPH